jgi:hypothetical protein
VQQHPVGQVEDLAGRADVDQHRARGEHPLDRRPVGRRAARVQRQLGQVGRAPEARRAPLDVGDVGALGARRGREHLDTGGDDGRRGGQQSAEGLAHAASPIRLSA